MKTPSFSRWQALLWALAGAVTASLAFAFLLLRHPAPFTSAHLAGEDRMLIREVSAIFPGQLNAIIEHPHGQEVKLTNTSGAFMSQPIVIELVRGQDSLRILTFSGQSVSLELGGKTMRLDFLMDAHNQVLVLGHDEVLFPRSKPIVEGYRLSARPIQASL